MTDDTPNTVYDPKAEDWREYEKNHSLILAKTPTALMKQLGSPDHGLFFFLF
jgi:hypothetical protein